MTMGGGGFGAPGGLGAALGGGGFGAGAASRATSGGAPFAGIPTDLLESVEKLTASEPDHGQSDAVFTHRPGAHERLTIMSLLRRRWKVAALSIGFVTVETI